MSEKFWKRLRLFLGILGILGFTFYFAFRTFIFDPLEGSFGPIPAVVPRNVDLFLRKTKLAEDFSTFPEPRFYGELSRSIGWTRFLESELYAEWNKSYELEKKLDDLERSLRAMPIDVLGDLLGREAVVAGRKSSPSGPIDELALFARVSWKVKFLLGCARYEWIRERFAPDLKMQETSEGIWKVQGAAPREVYLWRDRDLLVVGTSEALVRKAQDLLAAGGADSFGLSAKYADEIQRFAQSGNEFEAFVDLEEIARKHFGPGNWPAIQWDLPGRIAAQFLTPDSIREALSVLRFDDGMWLRSHLTLDSSKLSDFQRRLYDAQPLPLGQEIQEKAHLVPARCFFFASMACDAGEFLRALERALDDSQRRLVSDQIRSVGPYRDLRQMIDEFAPALKRNVFLMLRKNDYPRVADDPPNDGSPDPAWTFLFSIKNPDKVKELIDYFKTNRSAYGVEGLYEFDADGGYRAVEFFSQLIPATGEIAVLPAGDLLLVSNSPKFIREILKCRFRGESAAQLTDDPEFAASLSDLEQSSNLFVYWDAKLYEEVLREQIPFLAQKWFYIDYGVERIKAREKVIRENYPDYVRRALPQAIEKSVQDLIDKEMQKLEITLRGPGVLKLRKQLEDYALWMTSFPRAFLSLRTDPKKIDLTAKVLVEWR